MNKDQRDLVCGALALLEKQVAGVRASVAAGASVPRIREMLDELSKQSQQFVSAIDHHIGAEAVLSRAGQPIPLHPRAKTLSHSRPGSTRGITSRT